MAIRYLKLGKLQIDFYDEVSGISISKNQVVEVSMDITSRKLEEALTRGQILAATSDEYSSYLSNSTNENFNYQNDPDEVSILQKRRSFSKAFNKSFG